jgi:hypothetical protein
MIQPSLFDAPAPRAPAPVEAPLPRLAVLYRGWRDAMMRVARSERAFGCREAARVCARQALRDHRRMMASIRSGDREDSHGAHP